MVDIHTHILYGVDDGAKNLIDSLELLEEAEKVRFYKNYFYLSLYGRIFYC